MTQPLLDQKDSSLLAILTLVRLLAAILENMGASLLVTLNKLWLFRAEAVEY